MAVTVSPPRRIGPALAGAWTARRHARPSLDPMAAAEAQAWRSARRAGIGAFIVSRLLVFGAVYARAAQDVWERYTRGLPFEPSMRGIMDQILMQWDGRWFHSIASSGYPRNIPESLGSLRGTGATLGSLPLLPWTARGFDVIWPGGVDDALIAVMVPISLAAVVMVGAVARDLYDADVARRAMVLFCFYPGAMALTWPSAEPLLVLFAAAAFACMHRRRWLLAGAFAAVGALASPHAVALVFACLAAAVVAVAVRREWRALWSLLAAPLALIAFYAWFANHTGVAAGWWRIQRQSWYEGWNWGETTARYVWRFVDNPLAADQGAVYGHTALAVASLVAGLYCAVRRRIPAPMIVYCVVIAVMMLGSDNLTARPRLVLAAFPLAIAVAAWWPRRRHLAFGGLVLLSTSVLVGYSLVYAAYGAVP
ncbi:hypothetical protein [Desertimonas flava]|uniref:hypothetical protein n=1 Tax=Desertimonas flava TaxID=2064846 RepID=UPI000E356913|nr:hypothetical protein [Desertimonas flava]